MNYETAQAAQPNRSSAPNHVLQTLYLGKRWYPLKQTNRCKFVVLQAASKGFYERNQSFQATLGDKPRCRGRDRYVEGCWGFSYLKYKSYQNVHFMFLIDMKLISKILKKCLRGSSSFAGARFRLCNFSKCKKYQLKQNTKRFPTFQFHTLRISKFKNNSLRSTS